MKNLSVSHGFVERGGTELAPMSTSTELRVAAAYGMSRETLIFRFRTKNSLQRGVDVSWLSAFAKEEEVLYPPLTYMQPTGREQEVQVGIARYRIVEVKPTTV